MKYLHADVTILWAALIGGLIALGPAGSPGRAAAELGQGRHAMLWCTAQFGTPEDIHRGRPTTESLAGDEEYGRDDYARGDYSRDDYGREDYGDDNDGDEAYGDEGQSSEATSTADADSERMDYEHNYPSYGREDAYSSDDQYAGDDGETGMDDQSYANDDYTEGKTDDEPTEELAEETAFVPSPSERTTDEPTLEDVQTSMAYDEAAEMDAEYAEAEGRDYGRDETQPDMAATSDADQSAFEPEAYPWADRMYNEYQPDASETAENDESETSTEPRLGDAGWRYEYSYPESRYGYSMEQEGDEAEATESQPCDEWDAQTDEMYRGPSESRETNPEDLSNYQESMWEEKYGYDAEEMSGRASDEQSANAEERADEQSNAEMDSADYSPSHADAYTEHSEFRGAASEQGPASASDWDGEPNEANLEQGHWMPSENNEPVLNRADAAEGLERFGYLPSHLLIRPDQELLQELRRLADQSPGERQVAFRQYVESLGSVATEFATQYEEATDEDAAMLTDDIASTAAFLAVYRLYEQGELGIDEAIDLLRQTLDNLSQEWIDGVNEITTESDFGSQHVVSLEGMTGPASASAPRAMWVALSSWANQRVGQWTSALSGVWTLHLQSLDWQALVSTAEADTGNYHLD